ncbi:MAG: RidA family protein, partial [Pseudomonadota bacterium]
MSEIESRLAELGVTLDVPPPPAANYVPYVITGNQVFVSGQISQDETGFITGKLGSDLTADAGAA